MKYSEVKKVKDFCDGLLSSPCYREVVSNISYGVDDFEVNNVRFIKDDEILKVMSEDLESDPYVLGCFLAWFIVEQTGFPLALVEACQKGDAYEALGEAIINSVDMESFAEAYARADGYGHHFNRYDGNEEELFIGDIMYHVFDNH